MTKTFEIEGKTVNIFAVEKTKSPLVILNTYSDEGEAVFNAANLLGAKPFTLATISNLDWNADMSPWENPPLYKNDAPFSGKADESFPQFWTISAKSPLTSQSQAIRSEVFLPFTPHTKPPSFQK